jgi:hypothetical protein
MKHPFRLLFRLALLHGMISSASAEPQAAKPPAPNGVRVFYASHSLMWYVPEPLGDLATAAGIQGHELVGMQKIGASRTLQHWELPEAQNEARKALETGKVDVFVMSPIQFPDAGVENFVKLGLEHNPDIRFIVQLSWGGGDIDNQDFPNGAWEQVEREKTPAQLKKMNARNLKAGEAQAEEINKKYGRGERIMTLVPTSQAVVELRSRIQRGEIPGLKRQAELFVDPAHPSPPLEALNTYLHFAILYGRSPVGLPVATPLKNANRPEWDDKLNRELQEIAWQTASSYPPAGIASDATHGRKLK